MGVVTNLATTGALLGDAPRAAQLYTLLAPYAGQLIAPLVARLGSADRHLGQLAAVMGRWAEAERHFQAAIDMNRRMQQWFRLALAQAEYARMLVARGTPDDPERIDLLLADASEILDGLGMGDVLATVPSTRARDSDGETCPDEAAGVERRSSEVCLFQKEGEFWSVAYQGKVARLRHRKGFDYLTQLLRSPEREFAGLDLALGSGDPSVHTQSSRATGSITSSRSAAFGDCGPALDRATIEQFRHRRAELNAKLADAEQMNDGPRASRLQEDAALLAEQLSSANGGPLGTSVPDRTRHPVADPPTHPRRGAVFTLFPQLLCRFAVRSAALRSPRAPPIIRRS
jgi:hypothetical protein